MTSKVVALSARGAITDVVANRSILARADDGRQASILGALRDLDAMEGPWVSRASSSAAKRVTLEPLVPFARLASYRRSIKLDVTLSDFDAYYQELLDPASSLRRSRCNVVLLTSRWIDLRSGRNGDLDADAVADHVEDVVLKATRPDTRRDRRHDVPSPHRP